MNKNATIYSMQKVDLIGIPLDLGAENLGVDIGPNAFRYQKIIEKLKTSGLSVTDKGDILPQPRDTIEIGDKKVKYLAEITRIAEQTARQTCDSIKNKRKVIALGGDHSISLGTIAGASVAEKGSLGVIYLDAHGDMNTHETTLTGNIHGMHLAALMGFGHKKLIQTFGATTKVKPRNVLHIGGNDFDQPEIDLLNKEQIPNFSMFDLMSTNLGPLFPKIDALQKRSKNIWVSLDLDVIDKVYAPGAGMPNTSGFSYREIATIAEYIGKHCNVIGVDVAEYNPLQDIEGKTVELGIELIAKFFGVQYSWYTNVYLAKNKLK